MIWAIKWCLFFVLVWHCEGEETRRSVTLGSILGLSKAAPKVKYPIWKVHKYNGIELRPVDDELKEIGGHGIRQIYGEPPTVIHLPEGAYGVPVSELPDTEYDSEDEDDTSAALEALDQLGPLASFLPDTSDESLEELLGGREPRIQEKIGLLPVKKKKTKLLGLIKLAKALKRAGKPGPLAALHKFIKSLLGADAAASAAPVVPFKTTVYKPVETSSGGFFSNLPIVSYFFGRQPSGSLLPQLPALPAIPEIPNLELLPELPKVPGINLPVKYQQPVSAGAYVRVRFPKPSFLVKKPSIPAKKPYAPPLEDYGTPAPPEEHYPPPTQYAVPMEQPAPEEQPYPPANQYGTPQVQYSLPLEQSPQVGYSPPVEQPQDLPYPAQEQYSQTYASPQTQYAYPTEQPAQDHPYPPADWTPSNDYSYQGGDPASSPSVKSSIFSSRQIRPITMKRHLSRSDETENDGGNEEYKNSEPSRQERR